MNGLKCLFKLRDCRLIHTRLYLVEAIGALCTDAANTAELEKSNMIIPLLMYYFEAVEVDLRVSALSLTVNIVAISDVMRDQFLQLDGLAILTKMFLQPKTTTLARGVICKAISSLGQTRSEASSEILIFTLLDCIIPGLHRLFATMTDAIRLISPPSSAMTTSLQSSPLGQERSYSPVSNTTSSANFTPMQTFFFEAESSVEPIDNICSATRSLLSCVEVLMTPAMVNYINIEGSIYIKDLYKDIGAALLNSLVFALQEDQELEKVEVALTGLHCILNIVAIEGIRAILHQEAIFSILVQLVDGFGDEMTRNVLMVAGALLEHDYPRDGIKPEIFLILLKAVSKVKSSQVWPHFDSFVRLLCDTTVAPSDNCYVSLSTGSSSPSAIRIDHNLFIRNPSWTFESVRASHGVSQKGKYCYEFQIESDGIMQIGWAKEGAKFNEFGGWGVGDDMDSFSYDGNRKRKWNGRNIEEEFYGPRWNNMDLITCLIDLDVQEMSFLINGEDLGVAFKGFKRQSTYYPAVSLTSDQYGQFKFGSSLDKIQFCPEGFHPIIYHELPSSVPASLSTAEEPIDLDLYFEVRVGLLGIARDRRPMIGCIATNGDAFCLVFDGSTISFQKITSQRLQSGTLDLDIQTFIESRKEEPEGLQLFYSSDYTVEEGSFIGVALSPTSIQFTYNGSIIGNLELIAGPSIPIEKGNEFMPYIRNIPRYLLNFGQSDFKAEIGNSCFSPSRL